MCRSFVGCERRSHTQFAEVAVDKEMMPHKFVVVGERTSSMTHCLSLISSQSLTFRCRSTVSSFLPHWEMAFKVPNQMSICNISNTDDEIDVPPQYAEKISQLIQNHKAVDSVAEVTVKLRIVPDGEIFPLHQSPCICISSTSLQKCNIYSSISFNYNHINTKTI